MPTEVELRDDFHRRLSEIPGVTTEGWYTPPPHGIIMVIANPPDFARLEQTSYRPETAWPSVDERFDDESILYGYGSRVHIATGAIGDVACSLYRGSDQRIKAHLRRVWDVTIAICHETEIGMPLSDVYRRATDLIETAGLENNVYSAHNGSTTDVGHTLPWTDGSMLDAEAEILRGGDPRQVADLVSSKRRFVNATETSEITDGMALTIEPRLDGPGLPTVGFHVVVGFRGSSRVVITEFDPLFELFDMDGFDG